MNKLAKRREQLDNPSLSLAVENSITRIVDDGNLRTWQFTVQVTNESDRNNSIVQANLQITYRSADSLDYTYVASIARARECTESSIIAFNVPLPLRARESRLGIFHFEAPTTIFEEEQLVRHLIVITDAYGDTLRIEPIAIRKLHEPDG